MITRKNIPAVLLNMFVLLLLSFSFNSFQGVKAESHGETYALLQHSGLPEQESVVEIKGILQPVIGTERINTNAFQNSHPPRACLVHPFSWSSVHSKICFFPCHSLKWKHGKKITSLYILNRCLII